VPLVEGAGFVDLAGRCGIVGGADIVRVRLISKELSDEQLVSVERGKKSPISVSSSRHRPMVEGNTVKVLSVEAESFLTMRVKRPCRTWQRCKSSFSN
jgi:hypothetical protein